MASLTTTDQIEYFFDPGAVAAIRAVDAASAELIGLVKAPLRIGQSAEALLQSLGQAGKFAKLTDPAGDALWLAGGGIAYLRAVIDADGYPDAVKTVICAGGASFGVQEAVNAAATKVRQVGAKV